MFFRTQSSRLEALASTSSTPLYLVGFAESVATPEVCFSLRATGARVACFFRSNKKGKFARMRSVEYYPVIAPETDFNHTTHDIEALVSHLRPDLTAPCDDAALFVLSRLDESKTRSLAPTGKACDFALDKWVQLGFASASGFAVMKTQLVTSKTDIAQFPCRPAVLKPRAALDIRGNGLDKGPSFIIEDTEIPGQALEELAKRPYLIQEYKAGIGEGFFGIAKEGKIFASFGHRRLRMMNPAGSGASACISREPEEVERRAAEALIKMIKWRGPFMVELLRDHSGKAWFMEFNGRFWGSLALARRCGLDMPRLAAELACGKSVTIPSKIEPGFARHLGRDLVHLMFVMRGRHRGAHSLAWPGRFASARKIICPHSLKSFYNYNESEPLFFVKDAVVTVLNAIRGK